MATIYLKQGHSLSSLAPIAVELMVEQYPVYEKTATSDGITRNRGGATAVLSASFLTLDEAVELLDQFGINIDTPGAEITIFFEDYHANPTPFFGTVTLDISEREMTWWKNVKFRFSNLLKVR